MRRIGGEVCVGSGGVGRIKTSLRLGDDSGVEFEDLICR